MSAHTPGPFRIADDLDRMDCIGIYANKILVCEMRDPEDAEERERMRANAAYIVRACNAHEELVTALKLAQATMARVYEQHGHFSSVQGTYDVINAAIAKAEGRG